MDVIKTFSLLVPFLKSAILQAKNVSILIVIYLNLQNLLCIYVHRQGVYLYVDSTKTTLNSQTFHLLKKKIMPNIQQMGLVIKRYISYVCMHKECNNIHKLTCSNL